LFHYSRATLSEAGSAAAAAQELLDGVFGPTLCMGIVSLGSPPENIEKIFINPRMHIRKLAALDEKNPHS
jgi:hypothetical protein